MTPIERIPNAVMTTVRRVVLRHPRSMPCEVWRRQVRRKQAGTTGVQEALMAGLPTMGGMGVLSAEDEDDIEYVPLGAGRLLFCDDAPPGGMVMNDRGNAAVPVESVDAQIEALADPSDAAHYTVGLHDLVLLMPGIGAVVAFTAEVIPTPSPITPHVRRLTLHRRDDLTHIAPWSGAGSPP